MAWVHAASLDQANGRCRLGALFESSPEGDAGNLLTEGCLEGHPSCSARTRPSNLLRGLRTRSEPRIMRGFLLWAPDCAFSQQGRKGV